MGPSFNKFRGASVLIAIIHIVISMGSVAINTAHSQLILQKEVFQILPIYKGQANFAYNPCLFPEKLAAARCLDHLLRTCYRSV
ncbi:hypothetical protein CANARDRAFT_119811 [[Candida] arabinofermentans NRRL YB-2248]|uniref:Uncharacterized protein n=1 Tax=[Candida] arabinofermentans NRRL YB-2248 TaxID=983967 RepID=A0A1E4T5B9_9ASCO|nr:hypothetical protein CANARDRAFT_119811 [[Candida] arabinofermentans NRRL YB-2248]